VAGTSLSGRLTRPTGAAVIHEGERVVPEAQVADRGPAPVAGGGTGSGMSAGELERVMRAAVDDAMRSALSGARLSVDGDVASIEDVDRRVEERQRRTARRLNTRNTQ